MEENIQEEIQENSESHEIEVEISDNGNINISFVCTGCQKVNEITTPYFEIGCFSCSECFRNNIVNK